MNSTIKVCINQIDFNEIRKEKLIGRGAYGEVFSGKWRGREVAIKLSVRSDDNTTFEREKRNLSQVNHENIIQFFGTTFDAITDRNGLVMELADCGNLYKLLHINKSIDYKLCHAVNWILQCCKGVNYLHNIKPKPLLQRDLKPQNLLLFNNYNNLKICDFGVSRHLSLKMSGEVGSIPYTAPEVVENTNSYTEMCDIYSFAIILWEIISRKKPYEEINNKLAILYLVVNNDIRPPLIKGCPDIFEKVMTKCWSKDPNNRYKMEKLVKIFQDIYRFCIDANGTISPLIDTKKSLSTQSSYCDPDEDNYDFEFVDESVSPEDNCVVTHKKSQNRGKRILSKIFSKKSNKDRNERKLSLDQNSELWIKRLKIREKSGSVDSENRDSDQSEGCSVYCETIKVRLSEQQLDTDDEPWMVFQQISDNDNDF